MHQYYCHNQSSQFFSIDLICFSPIFCHRHRRNIIIACKFIANVYKQNNWHLSSTQHLLLKIINMFKAVCFALCCWSLTLPLNRHCVCMCTICVHSECVYGTELPCDKSSRWAHYHIWIKGAKKPYADSFSHYMHRATKHISNCRKKWFFFLVHSSTSIFRITQQQQHVFNFPIKILSWHDRHKCTKLYVLWNNVQSFRIRVNIQYNCISANCVDFIVL